MTRHGLNPRPPGQRARQFNVNPAVVADHAFEAPTGSGIYLHEWMSPVIPDPEREQGPA
jgi:hypothetical protein